MQESKSMGLGASFGGETSDVFGTSTALVLKKVHSYFGHTFLSGLCLPFSLDF